MDYDSFKDTIDHICKVKSLADEMIMTIKVSIDDHDVSKLESPEKELFDKYTPLLSSVTYGSDKYKKYLSEMGKALEHHYQNNRHHPECFENGINGMTLMDLIEMFCDWKAASLRHNDGSFSKSIEINKQRFNLSDQLFSIFINTANEMGWNNPNDEMENRRHNT